jgi:DNA polymerase-3 subunit chi
MGFYFVTAIQKKLHADRPKDRINSAKGGQHLSMRQCAFHDTDGMLRDRKLFELVEQVYEQAGKVVVFAATDERAAAIDRLLWIHRQESFIPHEVFRSVSPGSSLTIVIVTEELNPIGAEMLIADGHCNIEFAMRFKDIHEFVDRSSPQMHEACRNRFRAYRTGGIDPKHVK